MIGSDDEREAVRAQHAKGLGRNAIARELGMAPSQVSRISNELGLTFDASKIETAARKKNADLALRRAKLAELQLEDALRMREALWNPAIYGSFGGRENTWSEVSLDEPTFEQKLKIQMAVTNATANSMKISDADAGTARATLNLVIKTAEAMGLTEVDGE